MPITLSTARSRYAYTFTPINPSALTPGQRNAAATRLVTHVYVFEGAAPAWIERAATVAGYHAHRLGVTNARGHGGTVTETWGLAKLPYRDPS